MTASATPRAAPPEAERLLSTRALEPWEQRNHEHAKEMEEVTVELRSLLDHLKEHGELPPEETPEEVAAKLLEHRPRLAAPGWTRDKQQLFIEHLAVSGSVTEAVAAVGMTRQSAYQLRRREPHSIFGLLWDVAISLARQTLLDEATERALVGREVPVWHRGEQVGERVVHNDRLLMFLLRQEAPPPHPNLRLDQLLNLWPVMMGEIDGVLPPPDDAVDMTALGDRYRKRNGWE